MSGDLDGFAEMNRTYPTLLGEAVGGGNWLHIAARGNNPHVVQWLIAQGQDPNELTKYAKGNVPLFSALCRENLEVARTLLENGADPNLVRVVITPLVVTAPQKALEAIKLLEEYGADLHAVFTNEHTDTPMNALSTAKEHGLRDVVDYLLSKGAKLPWDDD